MFKEWKEITSINGYTYMIKFSPSVYGERKYLRCAIVEKYSLFPIFYKVKYSERRSQDLVYSLYNFALDVVNNYDNELRDKREFESQLENWNNNKKQK